MAMKKACCCMSTRMGSLIFLYMFLINDVWTVISSFTNLGDAVFKEFSREFATICYAGTFIAVIGCLIFLATIISISNDTPSISLLNWTIAISILGTIFSIFVMFYYTSEGVFEALCDAVIKQELEFRNPPARMQDEIRTVMKHSIAIGLKIMWFVEAINILVVIYAILVFHGYKTVLKENSVGASAPRNVNDKEANFTKPPTYSVQFTAPQHSQPSQYPQSSQYLS